MSRITNNSATSQTDTKSKGNAINDVDVDDFLDLMIAELQNQDPLNPMDNSQMLQQIGQMRQIASSEKLTETLDSVLLGQNISSATNLIGADIEAISDDNQKVSGVVQRVSIADGAPKLLLEEKAGASVSQENGELKKGEYNYQIVWEDNASGALLGIQTTTPLDVDSDNMSVLIANLPETDTAKQIYRTKAGGTGPYYLVTTLSNGKTAGYLDKTADADLSTAALNRTPVYVQNASRSFEVSLNNVGQIRPRPTTTTPTNNSGSNTNTESNTTNDTTNSDDAI